MLITALESGCAPSAPPVRQERQRTGARPFRSTRSRERDGEASAPPPWERDSPQRSFFREGAVPKQPQASASTPTTNLRQPPFPSLPSTSPTFPSGQAERCPPMRLRFALTSFFSWSYSTGFPSVSTLFKRHENPNMFCFRGFLRAALLLHSGFGPLPRSSSPGTEFSFRFFVILHLQEGFVILSGKVFHTASFSPRRPQKDRFFLHLTRFAYSIKRRKDIPSAADIMKRQ